MEKSYHDLVNKGKKYTACLGRLTGLLSPAGLGVGLGKDAEASRLTVEAGPCPKEAAGGLPN
jgi:hypothetical protein